MGDDEARTIGRRVRQIRKSRDKSLRVLAGLAAMNRMTLSRIERGERAPTLSEILALAGALEIAPSELTKLPVPAPANGHTDSTTEAVRLAVYLHTLVTRLWLWHSSTPDDLIRRVVFLAQRLAQEGNKLSSLAVATGCHAAAAVLAGRPGEATAPMDAAVEIAGQFEVDSRAPVPEPTDAGTDRFRFDSLDAATLRMWVALETGEPDQAVSIAANNIQPQRHPPQAQVRYWTYYGRALTRLRGRHDDAVRALRRAEAIHPHRVQRDPFVREALAELLTRTRRDSPAGRELRAMAHRAGLPE
jgi:transcriptional regulator with XRE-family HTH domain